MDVLLELAGVSLGGGMVILLLLLFTKLTGGRYAARWRCWAWVLLGLRLALPLSPPLPAANTARPAPIVLSAPENAVIYRSAPAAQVQTGLQTSGGITPVQPVQAGDGTDGAQTAPAAPEEGENDTFSLTLGQVLLGVWLLGAVGVLAWSGGAHLRFCRYLRRWSSPAEDPQLLREYHWLGARLNLRRLPRLRTCAGLAVPMLAGVVRPVLLLPEDFPPGEARCYSLLHELTHCRRRDIWLKTLMVWVCALHWFNPAVWLMARAVERDTELACDEGALQWLSRGERAAYGRAILQAAAAGKEL